MALRAATRPATRRLSTKISGIDKNAAKGPKLPAGNDASAFHGPAHAIGDSNRWRLISLVFGLPVIGFGIIQSTKPHHHVEPPPEYPYLKMATRVPRFPWGDDDLIGTSYERHAKEHDEGGH